MCLQAVSICRQENIWSRVSRASGQYLIASSPPHAGTPRKKEPHLSLAARSLFVFPRGCERDLSYLLSIFTHLNTMSDREFGCKCPVPRLMTCARASWHVWISLSQRWPVASQRYDQILLWNSFQTLLSVEFGSFDLGAPFVPGTHASDLARLIELC